MKVLPDSTRDKINEHSWITGRT